MEEAGQPCGRPASNACSAVPAPVVRAACCDGVRERQHAPDKGPAAWCVSPDYMMPVGTSRTQASAGATSTTPPAYIISCL